MWWRGRSSRAHEGSFFFFFTIRNVVVGLWHIFLFAQSIAFFFSVWHRRILLGCYYSCLSSINLCYFGISILSLLAILLRNIFLSLLSCKFTTPFVAIDDRSREENFCNRFKLLAAAGHYTTLYIQRTETKTFGRQKTPNGTVACDEERPERRRRLAKSLS